MSNSYNDHERDSRISRIESRMTGVEGGRGEDHQKLRRLQDEHDSLRRKYDSVLYRLEQAEQHIRDIQARMDEIDESTRP